MRVSLLSARDLAEIFEIRESLEGLACRLATQKMSDEAIEELSEAVEERRRGDKAENGATGPTNLDLHYRIVQECGNERLIELLCNDLYYAILFQRHLLSPEPGHASEGYREHREILSAMRERDADRAESLMRRHVRLSAERLKARQAQFNGGEEE
jgi:DNA-binding GntR family transcriptional regulator